jgi:hypothetical protein
MVETLRNRRQIEIRALRPDDQIDLVKPLAAPVPSPSIAVSLP